MWLNKTNVNYTSRFFQKKSNYKKSPTHPFSNLDIKTSRATTMTTPPQSSPTNRFGHRFTCFQGRRWISQHQNGDFHSSLHWIHRRLFQNTVWCHHGGMSTPSWRGKNIPLQLVGGFNRTENFFLPILTDTQFRVSVSVILALNAMKDSCVSVIWFWAFSNQLQFHQFYNL